MPMDYGLQLSRLDIAFASFLVARTSLEGQSKETLEQICSRLSYQQSQGHSCIIVDSKEQQLLQQSGLVSIKNASPLVLENNRLYLQRYWFYENRLAVQVRSLLLPVYSQNGLDSLLSRYFIELIDETDWQREAVKKSVSQAFSIISGGPGTGKTSVIVKILAILQELSDFPLYIALAAPTGKAAMRLQESIGSNKQILPCSEQIKNQIPETVTTLHSLLGTQVNSPFFKHDSLNPLLYDLVVIDEASMVDLALMSKLVDALKPGARLIMLGDENQLSSVESGAILADLTAALPDYTCELKKSYRFQSEIKAFADAVNTQRVDEAWGHIERGGANIARLDGKLITTIVQGYEYYLQCVSENAELTTIFSAFNDFQVLCSNRQGDRGVIAINNKVEEQLVKQESIRLLGQWYIGRPVMVMQNNLSMHLYNGDVGVCLHDQVSNKLAVFFLRADGRVKKINLGRMPVHETMFAMTIHKSQGSEFTECICVLADKMNPVLTKELLYTAITRAKEKITIACDYSIFCQTIQQKVERMSGLFEKLVLSDHSGDSKKYN